MDDARLLNAPFDSPEAVLPPGHTYESVGEKVASIPLAPVSGTRWQWMLGLAVSLLFLLIFLVAIIYDVQQGVGIWGVRIPAAWAFAITNFIWWIGIGHAGTLISAILLLVNQQWRTSINRLAEAMTIWAVMCAGLMPLLHLGRQWLFYWLFPYPNTMGVQPQFRSPLVWDVFAVLTYFTISLLFWFTGMIPDLASLRDRARSGLRAPSMASSRWAGVARRGTGTTIRLLIFCLPDLPHRS